MSPRTTATTSATTTGTLPSKPPRSKELPFLCSIWEGFHTSLLHVRILGCPVNVTGASMLIFFLLNLSVHNFLVSQLQWPDGIETSRAAAFCVGFFHTVNILPPLLQWVHWTGYEANVWGRWKTAHEKRCLTSLFRFSMAYFVYDSLYNLLYMRFWLYDEMTSAEWLFLLHHVVCVVALYTGIVLSEGYAYVALLMIFAEISNPFDNIVSFADKGLLLSPGPVLTSLKDHAQVVLSLLYFTSRGVLAPFGLLPLFSYQFWKYGRTSSLRVAVGIFRFLAMWSIELGSVPWVFHCVRVLRRRFLPGTLDDTEREEL